MIEYLTLEQIRTRVSRNTGREVSTTRGKGRVDDAINDAYAEYVNGHRWPELMRGRETGVTTTANEKFLFLPKDVGELYVVLPDVVDEVAPHQVIEAFLQRNGVSRDTAGNVVSYSDAGESGIKAVFSATAEAVTIASGTTGDTFDARIRGMQGTSKDVEVTETIAGITGAGQTSTKTYSDIVQVSLNGAHTDIVTVTGATSGTVYAEISPLERTARYKKLRIYRVPSSSETVAIYYKKRVNHLVNDDDVPEIPIGQVLMHKAMASMYGSERKWQAAKQLSLQEAEKLLLDVIGEDLMQGDRFVQMVPHAHSRGSVGRYHGRIVVNNNG